MDFRGFGNHIVTAPETAKPVRVVHTFHELAEPHQQAQMFAIALAQMGHETEIVELAAGNGWRVVSEDDEAVKMVDFTTD